MRAVTRLRLILLCVIALGLAGVMLRLGFWQLDRLDQRRSVNELRLERRAVAPVALPVSGGADELLERRVTASGRFITDATYRVLNRSYRGVPGHEIVNAFMLTSGELVLVNRGLFPLDRKGEAPTPPTGDTTLNGFLYFPVDDSRDPHPDALPLTDWVVLDPSAMAAELGKPFLPYALVLTERITEERYPIPKKVPDVDEGAHMSYAIQWFSFATITVGGVIGVLWVYFRRRLP